MQNNFSCSSHAQNTNIGVGAQSTLGGKTFLPEKYVWKINQMAEFYMILTRKIRIISEVLW